MAAAPEAEELIPAATLEDQFCEFARYSGKDKIEKRSGDTITLYRSDFWMRQAKILNDRHLTTTDTGIAFFKFEKSELNLEEWTEFMTDLCDTKGMNLDEVLQTLTDCGLPDVTPVQMPQYRDFFLTYQRTDKLVNTD